MKKVLEELEELIGETGLLDNCNQVEELATLIYQKIAENIYIEEWGREKTNKKLVFLIDVNDYPDYDIKADWRTFESLEEYMKQFNSNVDHVNALMRVGRLCLQQKSC